MILETRRGKLKKLRPFFSYMGSKWKLARTYPMPKYPLIIEPFAGSAGYSTRWHNREVLLTEINPQIVAIWEFLISASFDDIIRLPIFGPNNDIREFNLAEGPQSLISFLLFKGQAQSVQYKYTSYSMWKERDRWALWGTKTRNKIAASVRFIDHWKITHSSYSELRNEPATWFIDPPYQKTKLKRYKFSSINYNELASFCQSRRGQVIVCEQEGATWLPFKYHRTTNAGDIRSKPSREVIWTNNQ